MTVSEKEKRLQEVLLKTLALKNLIKRNIETPSEGHETISFPFIALEMNCDPRKDTVKS